MLPNEGLRSKHIRTLEVLQSVVRENAELKVTCQNNAEEIKVLREQLSGAVDSRKVEELLAKLRQASEGEKQALAKEKEIGENFLKMKSQRDEAEHDRHNLAKEVARLKEICARNKERASDETKQQIRSLDSEIRKLRGEVKDTQEALACVEQKRSEAGMTIAKLQVNLSSQRRENKKLQKRIESDGKSQSREDAKRASAESQRYGALEEHAKALEKENATLRARHATLAEANTKEKRKVDEATGVVQALRNRISELEEALSDFKRRTGKSSQFAKFVSLKRENRMLNSELDSIRKGRSGEKISGSGVAKGLGSVDRKWNRERKGSRARRGA